MIRVKSFGIDIRPLKTMQELQKLDATVERFIAENAVPRVISVSDAPTTDKGETIGLIRVLCYDDGKE